MVTDQIIVVVAMGARPCRGLAPAGQCEVTLSTSGGPFTTRVRMQVPGLHHVTL